MFLNTGTSHAATRHNYTDYLNLRQLRCGNLRSRNVCLRNRGHEDVDWFKVDSAASTCGKGTETWHSVNVVQYKQLL
jgi:hypothetical protein